MVPTVGDVWHDAIAIGAVKIVVHQRRRLLSLPVFGGIQKKTTTHMAKHLVSATDELQQQRRESAPVGFRLQVRILGLGFRCWVRV